ncbi:hypothetical protein [Streptococcus sp. S784/96/1]|uniref:hypothetical protein n=1 Tax=Streptococcus sp. S784/96/1 TaxID=2653499 RepID=UPI0013870B92|nr:hypothetical protein [Streptococcus sp. S784/96/1]
MKLKQKLKDNLVTILMGLLFIVGLIFLLIIMPYTAIRDTIMAKGRIIWYDAGHRGGMFNYEVILLGLFCWGLLMFLFKAYFKARQKIRKRQEGLKSAYEQLSVEEKIIQHKIDETLLYIRFLGYLPNNRSQGHFMCGACGYEWESKIDNIYKRRQCSQYYAQFKKSSYKH